MQVTAQALDRKTVADLYLAILVPWETIYRELPEKGQFNIKSKKFVTYVRNNNLEIMSYETKDEVDRAASVDKRIGTEDKEILIFQKGDNSRARSLLRHFRNSIAHARVCRKKIGSRWFLLLRAISNDQKVVLYGQIQQSRLREFAEALKSTVKNA